MIFTEKVKNIHNFLLGKVEFLATYTTHLSVFMIQKNIQNKVFILKTFWSHNQSPNSLYY